MELLFVSRQWTQAKNKEIGNGQPREPNNIHMVEKQLQKKAASGTELGGGTSYTRKLHFSVEKLFCYFEVGVGWKLYFIACLGAKLHTTDRLYCQIFWTEK